jgi:hypothetical protein
MVNGAASYTISDIGAETNITVAQAGVLTHASGYSSTLDTYTLSDTAANILGDSTGLVSGATSVDMNVNTDSAVTLVMGADPTINISGTNALILTLDSTVTETVNASAFSGSLTLTDSGYGDLISTGSGTTTITETSATAADTITFLANHSTTDTLVLGGLGGLGGFIDTVNNFALNQDVIQGGATPLTVGTELSASAGIVASGSYNASSFFAAAEALTGATAGTTVAWVDTINHNTYVAVFNGSSANSAHIVELVGVQATTIGTGAGSSIHIA